MLNIRLRNLPPYVHNPQDFSFRPDHLDTLRQVIGTVLSCPADLPCLILERSEDQLIIGSELEDAPVQVIIESYSDTLTHSNKSGLAQAVYSFLKIYHFDKDLSIRFVALPEGLLFTEKEGKLIPTPHLPTPHFNYRGFHQGKR